MLWNALWLLALALIIRAAYYFYYYRRAIYYLETLTNYLNKQDNPTYKNLQDVSNRIAHLMKVVGLDKRTIPVVQAMGHGQLASMNIHPYDNLTNLREDVASANLGLLEKAKSLCKGKALDTFNPIYWLESLIYLPTNVSRYIGLKKEGSFVKLLQVLWWLFAAFAAIIGVVFNKEFTSWLSDIAKNI